MNYINKVNNDCNLGLISLNTATMNRNMYATLSKEDQEELDQETLALYGDVGMNVEQKPSTLNELSLWKVSAAVILILQALGLTLTFLQNNPYNDNSTTLLILTIGFVPTIVNWLTAVAVSNNFTKLADNFKTLEEEVNSLKQK